ncbi:MAG TPA: hypothetical protein VGT41_00340 [Candidatus Babeliales bacterium]|nr:hypothetical protein [Candidatus Babeliales bacterium]
MGELLNQVEQFAAEAKPDTSEIVKLINEMERERDAGIQEIDPGFDL